MVVNSDSLYLPHLQDYYGVQKLKQVSQRSNFLNRYTFLREFLPLFMVHGFIQYM